MHEVALVLFQSQKSIQWLKPTGIVKQVRGANKKRR
jgi:hypothetical protein